MISRARVVVLKGACRNYDALWYCLARCWDVGSDYNIFFFCSVLLTAPHHTSVRNSAPREAYDPEAWYRYVTGYVYVVVDLCRPCGHPTHRSTRWQ